MNIRRIPLIAAPLLAALAAFAIVNAGGVARDAGAQPVAKLALDMDPTNGDSPCNPIDDTLSVNPGDTYEIAVCLTNAPAAAAVFGIQVLYDNTLDECVPVDCAGNVGCPDSNPDANAGTTSWTTPNLGNCDCSIPSQQPPFCDKGLAFLNCDCIGSTLPFGEGVTTPVAMIKLKATENGTDTFSFGTVALYSDAGDNLLRCPGENCSGGTVETLGSLPTTPTVEGTAPAGTTPGLDATASKTPVGKATAKPGAANQQSNGGSSGPSAILIAGIIVVAAIVVGGAGWFGYRRFRATR